MKNLFEWMQAFGAVGGIIGLGWFIGMVIGSNAVVSVWLVVGPLGVSMLALSLGYILELVFEAGIKSTVETEEESE